MYYRVIEDKTGCMDGNYGDAADAEEARKHWDSVRPQYSHWVSTAHIGPIPDHLYLGYVHHRSIRDKVSVSSPAD